MKRVLIVLGYLFLLAAGSSAAHAAYPDRPVHVFVPVAAGGGVDVMARLLAQRLSDRLGQQFVVENRPGAAGVIGTKSVVGSEADGYTLLMTPSSLVITVAVDSHLPYDVMRDLTPICNVALTPYALAVNPKVPASTVAELIAYAKAHPDALNFSSAGIGSASHLAGELFKSEAGIQMVHVPNKGMHPALLDVLGGQTQILFGSLPATVPEEKAGHIRLLALADLKRSALLPDLKTLDELGLKGFEVGNWEGMLAPAGLDHAIVDKLNSEIIYILDQPDVKGRLAALGFERIASTPDAFKAQMQRDIAKWIEVVKRAGIAKN